MLTDAEMEELVKNLEVSTGASRQAASTWLARRLEYSLNLEDSLGGFFYKKITIPATYYAPIIKDTDAMAHIMDSDRISVRKCECGAHKATGCAQGAIGHSSWCPWAQK